MREALTRAVVVIEALLVLAAASQTVAQELNIDPVMRQEADSYAGDLVQEWGGARNPSTIRQLLRGLQQYGPPSHSTEASLVPVLVGIIDDMTDFNEFSQYLAVSQLNAMQVTSTNVMSAYEECLVRTNRDLPRLTSGVSLVLLGHIQGALPVVDEYARTEWTPPDSLDSLGIGYDANPVSPFLLPPDQKPLRLSNSTDEDSLNAYFTRVLSYSDTLGRISAIDFLLQKGIAVEQALQAAQDLLEHIEPGPYEYAQRHNLVYILETFGGERGKAIAAPYGQYR